MEFRVLPGGGASAPATAEGVPAPSPRSQNAFLIQPVKSDRTRGLDRCGFTYVGNVGEVYATLGKWPNAALCLDRKAVFKMAMVFLALDDDPVDGYPKYHARDDPVKLVKYSDDQAVFNPEGNSTLRRAHGSDDTSGAIARKAALNRRFSCSLPTYPSVPKAATIASRIMFLIPLLRGRSFRPSSSNWKNQKGASSTAVTARRPRWSSCRSRRRSPVFRCACSPASCENSIGTPPRRSGPAY